MLLDELELELLPPKMQGAIRDEQRRVTARYGDQPRRVLLVGGAGYIGGVVTAHLLARGAGVRTLDLLTYNHGASIISFLPHPRYEFMAGDMGDRSTMDRALKDVTDVVILAGLVGDPITKKFPGAAGQVNDAALRACIDSLAGRKLNKVIFISTCSNYGIIPDDQVATETFELKPLSLYANSKVAAERHLMSLRGSVDFAVTILRFATAFGLAPRMRFDLSVNEFTRELFLNRELVVFDAHTWRPYCHVRDFARLISRVLDFPVDEVAFEVFNAGGDTNNHTKQSIVDLILSRLPDRNVVYREHSDDRRNYRVSFEKVRTRLGFLPLMSVADGVDEVIWALASRMLDDADLRRTYYGNYDLPGFQMHAGGPIQQNSAPQAGLQLAAMPT